MNIRPFAVEEWMNEYEDGARYNIAETCVDSVSLDKLFALTGEDRAAFLADFGARLIVFFEFLRFAECLTDNLKLTGALIDEFQGALFHLFELLGCHGRRTDIGCNFVFLNDFGIIDLS